MLFCLLGSFFSVYPVFSQSFITDSLEDRLKQPGQKPEERTLTLSHLARNLYETNMPAAIRYAQEAIQQGNSFTDGQFKAFGFATLAYLNVQRDSLLKAQGNIDSALFYSEKTANRIVQGYVWLRKGWLEYIVNSTDKAVGSMLKAHQLLEGQEAYEYESLVYHYLASLYADFKDTGKFEKYMQLSLLAAYKAGGPDIICNAYLTTGSSFLRQFRQDSSKKYLLDSALYYNRSLLALAHTHPDRIVNHSTVAAAALNTANIYWEFFPATYRDSVEKYINTALVIARHSPQRGDIIANCYGILSEYALAAGDYQAAEKLLLSGLAEIENSSNNSNRVKAGVWEGLATVAEKTGDKTKALEYYKKYLHYVLESYNAEKLAIAQRLEVQYGSEKKDREMEVLQERASLNRKLNIIYISLALASLLALLFLFSSYRLRLKASLQQQKLRAEEAARLKAEQELLQERQVRLQKELLAGSLQVEEKNELLHSIRDKIGEETGAQPLKNQVDRIIRENDRMDADFELVKTNFAEIHPGFFTRLQQKANNTLTRLDLRYCSYILMGLSNKEIANRLSVDPKSIRMARYRIKQKLLLGKSDSLDEVIRALG